MQACHKQRVESEQIQDYVCEMLTISLEEAGELAFVPSAISEPRGASDTGNLHQRWLKKVEKLEQ